MRISFLIVLILFSSSFVQAREQIRIVGSSTLYPFITVVSERFGKQTKFRTPIVEANGTGGGFKIFCSGRGAKYPDIVAASREVKESEIKLCAKNGVKNIEEITVGFDGIVLASSTELPEYKLTKKQVFLAISSFVPKDGKVVPNFYKKWSDIDKKLPDRYIEIYGPSYTSGTRDAFLDLVSVEVCHNLKEFILAYPDKKERKKACKLIRDDGTYIEMGENDNLIIQKLIFNSKALGIVGYNFYEQNSKKIQPAIIDGVKPSFKTISDDTYGISRPLFLYINKDHIKFLPHIKDFIAEVTDEGTIGAEGYLVDKGLVPKRN